MLGYYQHFVSLNNVFLVSYMNIVLHKD